MPAASAPRGHLRRGRVRLAARRHLHRVMAPIFRVHGDDSALTVIDATSTRRHPVRRRRDRRLYFAPQKTRLRRRTLVRARLPRRDRADRARSRRVTAPRVPQPQERGRVQLAPQGQTLDAPALGALLLMENQIDWIKATFDTVWAVPRTRESSSACCTTGPPPRLRHPVRGRPVAPLLGGRDHRLRRRHGGFRGRAKVLRANGIGSTPSPTASSAGTSARGHVRAINRMMCAAHPGHRRGRALGFRTIGPLGAGCRPAADPAAGADRRPPAGARGHGDLGAWCSWCLSVVALLTDSVPRSAARHGDLRDRLGLAGPSGCRDRACSAAAAPARRLTPPAQQLRSSPRRRLIRLVGVVIVVGVVVIVCRPVGVVVVGVVVIVRIV